MDYGKCTILIEAIMYTNDDVDMLVQDALISLGFFHLFNKNQDEALRHSEKFLTEQDAAEFHNSRVLGGSEYFDFMGGKIKMPNGLARIFHQEN